MLVTFYNEKLGKWNRNQALLSKATQKKIIVKASPGRSRKIKRFWRLFAKNFQQTADIFRIKRIFKKISHFFDVQQLISK